MRSSADEKVGQLPAPMSVTVGRPCPSSIEWSRVRLKSVPGEASKRIRRPSCDQAGEPQ